MLTEKALARGEGKLSETGALVTYTGKYTGRSPDDKFIVDVPSIHDEIEWGKVNVPISEEKFNAIYNKMMAYLQGARYSFSTASPAQTRIMPRAFAL